MRKYKVVDLFAGAGGLSLGFKQTQKYEIVVAFENNPAMQETYRHNHKGVDVRGDVCTANYYDIQRQYGKIDVVIGGPPCQGFSNANRQRTQAVSHNNMLVKQFIRAITELQPKAFVMENVSMLRSDVHRFYFDEEDAKTFNTHNIEMTPTKLVLLEKEYLFDGVLDVVKSYSKIVDYLWPEHVYSTLNVIYKASKNTEKLAKALEKHRKNAQAFLQTTFQEESNDYISMKNRVAFDSLNNYYNGTGDVSSIRASIAPAIMIQRMLNKAMEIFDNHLVVEDYQIDDGLYAIIKSYAVFDYLQAILGSEPNNYCINSNVLCAADFGAPQRRMRFVAVGIKKDLVDSVELPEGIFTEDKYRTVRDAIADLEFVPPITDAKSDFGINIKEIDAITPFMKELRDSNILHNHIVTNTGETALQRFKALKQGQNFHSLDESLKSNTYTDISRTQNTIYLRLDYDRPSGTVVNVRKSMWVHPTMDRAVSIREAARLQTFPDSFVFCGSKDKQYQQVGNAVPPIMAKAIAQKLAEQLERKR